jgi:valyl-tRNA synthetase
MIHVDHSIQRAQSVLLTRYPTFLGTHIDHSILTQMRDLQRVCQMVRAIRSSSDNHTSRMVPFRVCTISHADGDYLSQLKGVIHTIKSELNVERFEFETLDRNIDLEVKVNPREMGRAYRADSKKIQAVLAEFTTESLFPLYSGHQDRLMVDIGTEDTPNPIEFEFPNRYFELVAVPKTNEGTNDSTYTSIDTDLMVRVDPTYDAEINHTYQARLLHSAIQKARKTMGLRPWQSVTVMVDNAFVTRASGDVIENLKESLPSETTSFLRATFGPDDLEGMVLGGVREIDTSKTFVDRFNWTLVGEDGETTIEGYFGVHYFKS